MEVGDGGHLDRHRGAVGCASTGAATMSAATPTPHMRPNKFRFVMTGRPSALHRTLRKQCGNRLNSPRQRERERHPARAR